MGFDRNLLNAHYICDNACTGPEELMRLQLEFLLQVNCQTSCKSTCLQAVHKYQAAVIRRFSSARHPHSITYCEPMLTEEHIDIKNTSPHSLYDHKYEVLDDLKMITGLPVFVRIVEYQSKKIKSRSDLFPASV